MNSEHNKILMIAPTPFFSDRGCHVRILEEIESLKEEGFHIELVTYHLGRDIKNIRTTRTVNIPWYNKKSPGPSYHKFYLDILLFFKSLQVLRKNDFKVIHGHLHEGALIAIWLKKILKIPVVFDVQGSLIDELVSHRFMKPNGMVFRFFKRLESYIYKNSDFLIVSSAHTANIVSDQFDISPKKVKIIVDGINTKRLSSYAVHFDRINLLKKQLNIPSEKIIVGFLGALNEYQGVDILLDTVKTISEMSDIKTVHFLIMGYPNVEKYKNKAVKMDISKYITFTGKINYELVGDYLSLLDIAVTPKISLTEANGKLINYMAMGLPIVAFDTPVNKQFLGAEYTFFADIENHQSFTEKLISIIRLDQETRKKIGRKLKEKVLTEFDMKDISLEIINVYKEVSKN